MNNMIIACANVQVKNEKLITQSFRRHNAVSSDFFPQIYILVEGITAGGHETVSMNFE